MRSSLGVLICCFFGAFGGPEQKTLREGTELLSVSSRFIYSWVIMSEIITKVEADSQLFIPPLWWKVECTLWPLIPSFLFTPLFIKAKWVQMAAASHPLSQINVVGKRSADGSLTVCQRTQDN